MIYSIRNRTMKKSTYKHRPKQTKLTQPTGIFPNSIRRIYRLFSSLGRLISKNKLLSTITLLGIALRLLGTNPGYPQIHSDEPSIQEATRILVMYHKYDPQNYYYGSLLSILYAIFIILIGIPVFFMQVLLRDNAIVSTLGIFGFLDYFYQKVEHGSYYFDTVYNFFPYWTRYATAILSATASILVYLLTSRLFKSKRAGLVAAFLTATNYRHVVSSTLTLADAPAAVFILLSLVLSTKLLRTQKTKTYIWAGIGIGLALSVKYFIYILPAYFICSALGAWSMKSGLLLNCRRIILNRNLYLALGVTAVVFVIINPYLFINREEVDYQMYINAKRYGLDMKTLLPKITPPFDELISPRLAYPYWYLFRYGYGQVLSLTIIAGVFYGIYRYRTGTLLILSVLVPYFFVFTAVTGNTPVRNFAPITPLLLIFPALLIVRLAERISSDNRGAILIIILTLIISYSSTKNSILSSYYASKPLNYNLGFAWMNEHLQDDQIIARTAGSFIQKNHIGVPLLLYDGGIGLSIDELRKAKAKYVIITTSDTTLSNMTTLSTYNSEIQAAFLNDEQLWNIMNNTYLSLSLKELATYPHITFTKPYWQSLEPAVLIAKIQPEVEMEEMRIVDESFENNEKQYSGTSPLTGKHTLRLATTEGIKGTKALHIPFSSCRDLLAIQLKKFNTTPGFRYKLSAHVNRTTDSASRKANGFFRLNFYDEKGSLILTNVTKLSQKDQAWETLTASGAAPKESGYATVEFQMDTCNANESFALDNLEIYKSEIGKTEKEMLKEAPQKLPQNFIWLPEIL